MSDRYLLYLTITIYNDETYGIFRQEPPTGVLPELKEIPFSKDFPPAAWEAEKQWPETLDDLPKELKCVRKPDLDPYFVIHKPIPYLILLRDRPIVIYTTENVLNRSTISAPFSTPNLSSTFGFHDPTLRCCQTPTIKQ